MSELVNPFVSWPWPGCILHQSYFALDLNSIHAEWAKTRKHLQNSLALLLLELQERETMRSKMERKDESKRDVILFGCCTFSQGNVCEGRKCRSIWHLQNSSRWDAESNWSTRNCSSIKNLGVPSKF